MFSGYPMILFVWRDGMRFIAHTNQQGRVTSTHLFIVVFLFTLIFISHGNHNYILLLCYYNIMLFDVYIEYFFTAVLPQKKIPHYLIFTQ